MKPLSENLSAMSERAKKVEDNFAAAKTEASEQLAERREKARAQITATIDRIDGDLERAGDRATSDFAGFKQKVAGDRDRLKKGFEQGKHDLQVRQTENRAEDYEFDAALAIDYAVSTIEQAELAVLDALSARIEAETTKLEPAH
jgi:hypothetical protein